MNHNAVRNFSTMLPIAEITVTLSGEVGPVPAGTKIVLVRFMGCNLKCPYCDTPSTQKIPPPNYPGTRALETVVDTIAHLMIKEQVNTLLFTGGEPLLWEKSDCALTLIYLLVSRKVQEKYPNKNVVTFVETNGSMSVEGTLTHVSRRFSYVVDMKLFMMRNIPYHLTLTEWFAKIVTSTDVPNFLKVPVTSVGEAREACRILAEKLEDYHDTNGVLPNLRVFFAPVVQTREEYVPFAQQLASSIVRGELNDVIGPSGALVDFAINVQLHKILNVL